MHKKYPNGYTPINKINGKSQNNKKYTQVKIIKTTICIYTNAKSI